ncbi:amidohydrolase [Superficieibacter electus]|nr:amidohydrolase family protein [Superficieibacter electus]
MNMNNSADLILQSENIFTAASNSLFSGYIVIRDGVIIAMVPAGQDIRPWCGPDTQIRELGERLVCPGFCDNHTFFTGYMSMRRGVDLSQTDNSTQALAILTAAAAQLSTDDSLYAWGWSTSRWGALPDGEVLDIAFPQRPVVAINNDKSYCWMNQAAIARYGFTPGECSAEARVHLLNEMLADTSRVREELRAFIAMLASRGVTAIKDVCFDSAPALLDAWAELESQNTLPLRVSLVSEPVAEPVNFAFGQRALARFHSPRLRFHGFKFMVDGVIADHTGDMLQPYADRPQTHNEKPVNYEALRQQVLAADRAGFDCCLNAEGDAAIRHCIDIFAACLQNNPPRLRHHSISDLECPHPDDIPRMAALGIYAEVYAQILLLNPGVAEAWMRERGGDEREAQFYDYAALFRAGVVTTIGTDLPLFIPSIPDSMYAACCRHFVDGSPAQGWYRERGMTRQQLLLAWTRHSAQHHGTLAQTGSLEVGKYADIAVFDRNLLACPDNEVRSARVVLTLVEGSVTYDTL